MRVLVVYDYLLLLIFLTTSADAGRSKTSSLSREEDDWVDPYDFNFDEVTQKNKPSEEWRETAGGSQCPLKLLEQCRNCFDFLSKNDSDIIEKPVVDDSRSCPSSDFLFVHFSRSLLKLLESSKSPEVVITLSSHQKDKLQQYVGEQTLTAGEIAEMLASSMGPVTGGNDAISYNNLGISTNQVVIGLLMLVLTISIFTVMMTCKLSLFRVVVAGVLSVFFVSCIISYMFLYQKAIAKRMADDAQRMEFYEACKSTHNASLFSNIGSFFKNIFTNRDSKRACEQLFEHHQIDIMLEVLPIDAITDTFGSVITGLAKFSGEGLGQFMDGLYGNLPFASWIPASLLLLASLAIILYCRPSKVIVTERHEPCPEITHEKTSDRIEHVCYHSLPFRETGEHQETRRERIKRRYTDKGRVQEIGAHDQSTDHCCRKREADICDRDKSRDQCPDRVKESAMCDARKGNCESVKIPDSSEKPIKDIAIQDEKKEDDEDTSRYQESLSEDKFEVIPDEKEPQRETS